MKKNKKMWHLIKAFFRKSKGQQLSKDANQIIENALKSNGDKNLRLIAKLAVDKITEVRERGLNNPDFYDRGMIELRTHNKEAKVRNDQSHWTAGVLSVIYLESERLGREGEPSLKIICRFLESYNQVNPRMMKKPKKWKTSIL